MVMSLSSDSLGSLSSVCFLSKPQRSQATIRLLFFQPRVLPNSNEQARLSRGDRRLRHFILLLSVWSAVTSQCRTYLQSHGQMEKLRKTVGLVLAFHVWQTTWDTKLLKRFQYLGVGSTVGNVARQNLTGLVVNPSAHLMVTEAEKGGVGSHYLLQGHLRKDLNFSN